jgi:hypothetical protein
MTLTKYKTPLTHYRQSKGLVTASLVFMINNGVAPRFSFPSISEVPGEQLYHFCIECRRLVYVSIITNLKVVIS